MMGKKSDILRPILFQGSLVGKRLMISWILILEVLKLRFLILELKELWDLLRILIMKRRNILKEIRRILRYW